MLAAHARTAVGCRTARAVGSIPSMSGGSDAYPRTRPTRTRPASRGRRAAAASARARDDGSIEDDGDDSADWRAGPALTPCSAPCSPRRWRRRPARIRPPLKRVESDDAPALAPATLETPPAAAAIDEALRSVDEDPTSVASPFCSITFVDESGTFDGEGDILPPMADPATAAPAPLPTRPRRHPRPNPSSPGRRGSRTNPSTAAWRAPFAPPWTCAAARRAPAFGAGAVHAAERGGRRRPAGSSAAGASAWDCAAPRAWCASRRPPRRRCTRE